MRFFLDILYLLLDTYCGPEYQWNSSSTETVDNHPIYVVDGGQANTVKEMVLQTTLQQEAICFRV